MGEMVAGGRERKIVDVRCEFDLQTRCEIKYKKLRWFCTVPNRIRDEGAARCDIAPYYFCAIEPCNLSSARIEIKYAE